jgi:P27 family predicted phage terminase small subunit
LSKTKIPKGLGTHGRALWRKIEAIGEIDGAQELLVQLCTTADRLAQVRESLAKAGLLIKGEKGVVRHPLLDVELRLVAQYGRLWKILGLADDTDEPKRSPGRPPETERRRWRR